MINVTQQINAVRREVGRRLLEAGEGRTVTVSQTYEASIDDVWDACTNPERIRRWFLPISGDLRLHGRFELAGNASGTIERRQHRGRFQPGGRPAGGGSHHSRLHRHPRRGERRLTRR
jgi:hypothetical protein